MTIKRSVRRKNYALIDQKVFDDERLDHKLLGILTYLLSKPDNWQTNSRHLSIRFKSNIDTIKKHLAQLEEIGYMERIRARNHQGQFEWITVVHEVPITQKTIDGKTSDGKTSDGKTCAGKPVDITNKELTITEFNQNHHQEEDDDDFVEKAKPEDPFFKGQARMVAREVVKATRQMNGPRNFITAGPWGELAEELDKNPSTVWNQFRQWMIAKYSDKKDPENYVGVIANKLFENPGSELACKDWLTFADFYRKNKSAPPPPQKKQPKAVVLDEIPDRQESMKAVRAAREAFNKAIGRAKDE